ncbi:MAG: hypothetical protein SFV18_17910 [Bryobacteraceae bacterium]|nr:hypothetical protein [Bryobacteraceae bacterium]
MPDWPDYVDSLRRKNHSVLLDTNVLLLWIVGSYLGYREVEQFSRLSDSGLTTADFKLLAELIDGFEILTTPNVLTESSNLLEKVPNGRHALREASRDWPETFVPSRVAMDRPEYRYLGLTDAAILETGLRRKCLVLTTDAVLERDLSKAGVDAVNFNHVKQWHA